MRSRNVIFSLLLVLAMLALGFIKMRFWEPQRKLTFKRSPSRIEYRPLALCRMDCHHLSASDITEIIRKGEVDNSKSNLRDKPCPTFVIHGYTRSGVELRIIVAQCGTIAKIMNCINLKQGFNCDCPDDPNQAISFYKSHY